MQHNKDLYTRYNMKYNPAYIFLRNFLSSILRKIYLRGMIKTAQWLNKVGNIFGSNSVQNVINAPYRQYTQSQPSLKCHFFYALEQVQYTGNVPLLAFFLTWEVICDKF